MPNTEGQTPHNDDPQLDDIDIYGDPVMVEQPKPTGIKGFFVAFANIFRSTSPNKYFARMVLILFVFATLATIYLKLTANDETVNDVSTPNERQSDRVDNDLPDQTRQKIMEDDAEKADKHRKKNLTFSASRPEGDKTALRDLVNQIKHKPKPSQAEKAPAPEVIDQPKTFGGLSLRHATDAVQERAPKDLHPQHENSSVNSGNRFLNEAKRRLESNKDANDSEKSFTSAVLVKSDPQTKNKSTSESQRSTGNIHSRSLIGSAVEGAVTGVTNHLEGRQLPLAQSDSANRSPQQRPSKSNENKKATVLSAGHFVFGVSKTAVNTDLAAKEVVGEIAGGPLDGCRIVGQWKRVSDTSQELSLVYNVLSYRGESIPINLIAFNVSTKLPGFVSEVDRHLLYRFGGLISGSLMAAMKDAATTSSLSSNSDDDNSYALTSQDMQKVLWSSTGDKVGDKLTDMFDRPITSKVYANQEMQLLAMEPVAIPTKLLNTNTGCSGY